MAHDLVDPDTFALIECVVLQPAGEAEANGLAMDDDGRQIGMPQMHLAKRMVWQSQTGCTGLPMTGPSRLQTMDDGRVGAIRGNSEVLGIEMQGDTGIKAPCQLLLVAA